jgi:OmpA-OmpF porin, OOP family
VKRLDSRIRVLLFATACAVSWHPSASAQNSDALPRIQPFGGSRLLDQSGRDLEEYWLPIGKLYGNGQAEKVRTIEGKWSHFTYENPPGRTVLEVFSSYEDTLRQLGFEIVYSCKDAQCGQGGRKTNADWWDPNHVRRYLAAKRERPEGDLWIAVHVYARQANALGRHDIDIVEAKTRSESVAPHALRPSAGPLYEALMKSGHAAVYGITWDAKGQVSPGSVPSLQAIAELLSSHPQLQLYLVVHTDNVGGVQANVERSRKQATTLANLLAKSHGVPAARIRPSGMGPLAPVAANDTEEGRARNRRVELVRP